MKKRERERNKAYGQMTRREFTAGAAGLGVATAVAGVVGSIPAMAQAAPKPMIGGTATLAFSEASSTSDTMDPRRESFSSDHARNNTVLNTLIRCSTKLMPEPELAISWDSSPDVRVWTFKLRQGVVFHNGKTLTSDDVVYSINLHRAPNESVVKSLFSTVKDVKADGKDAVRIELSEGNADFPMYLSSNTGIVPAGFTDFGNLIGTGPFKLKSFRPGVRMSAERNTNYWKSGLPYLGTVEIIGVPNAQARVNALLSGDVQFMTRVDPHQVPLIEKSDNAKMAAAKSGKHITMIMMCDRPPFQDNVDLRLALKYAVDRVGMLRDVRRGYGIVANDQPISPFDPYFDHNLEQRVYDPDKSKFHLKKAGLSSFNIELDTSEVLGSEAVDMAVHLQQSAAKCGITIDVKRQPADSYYTQIWMKRPFHMSLYQPRPTADMMLSLVYASNAKWFEARFKSDRIDQLLQEGRGTRDVPKRRQIYYEIQKIISEQGGTIIPMFMDFLDARASRLEGFEANPLGEAGGLRLSEKIWVKT